MIQFACPRCQNNYRLPYTRAGASFQCGACGERLLIPSPVEFPDEPPEADETVEEVDGLSKAVDGLYKADRISAPDGRKPERGRATAALVVGILSLCASVEPWLGLVVSLTGICLALVARNENGGEWSGFSKSGLVLGIIGIAMAGLASVAAPFKIK